MVTVRRFSILILFTVLGFNFGCTKGADSPAPDVAASQSTLTILPNPATVAPSGTITITPGGGTAPYAFSVLNALGTFSVPSGLSSVFTAPPSAGTALIEIVDANANIGYFQIEIVASSSGTLAISPKTTTVAPSGTVTFSATGGTAPYTYSVLTSGGGTIAANIYTAPAIVGNTVTVQVMDSAGNVDQSTVTVAATASTSTSCEGTYTTNIGGTTATLSVVDDSMGNLIGYVYYSNFYFPVHGTCSVSGGMGTISFTDSFYGHVYSAAILTSNNQVTLSGTYTVGTSIYAWSGTLQGMPNTVTSTSQSCSGMYNATINGVAGTISLVGDGGRTIAGIMTINGYYYALSGTCSVMAGVTAFTNLTTGSAYMGTVTVSGTAISMSGTFKGATGTASYPWSAH